uniref:Uncharacterized protein n=1 Tax=Coccidioides posadasii RMSCC 3488 TaxID=454284 RepID=A0A0J6FD64_COCPO|nr:hypothetical protein CPAG_07363 [Coccidioides posadasii RMSCC 3488]
MSQQLNMAMESTFSTRQGTDAQPLSEMSGSFVSNQSNYSGSPVTETIVDVEPWMQEMLNEDLFSTPPLEFGSAYPGFMAAASETSPSAPTMNDSELLAPNTWPTFATDNYGFVQNGDSAFVPEAADFPSFSTSTAFDEELASFLSGHQAFDDGAALAEMNAQQNFDAFSEHLPTPGNRDDNSQTAFNQIAAAFRDLARARAEADPRPMSRKQKQRDASIALYLERLRDACDDAVAVINSSNASNQSDNGSSFSSPNMSSLQNSFHNDQVPVAWGQGSASECNSALFDNAILTDLTSQQCSPGESSAAFTTSVSTPSSDVPSKQQPAARPPVTGGLELVMDLNMNAATSLPRRHRPRTQAQRERYLAVRSRGACEKHKKQHKRCTCVDKELASKQNAGQRVVNSKLCDAMLRRQSSTVHSQNVDSSRSMTNSPTEGYVWCPGGSLDPKGPCECTSCHEDMLRWQYLQNLDKAAALDPMQKLVHTQCQAKQKRFCVGKTLQSGDSGEGSVQDASPSASQRPANLPLVGTIAHASLAQRYRADNQLQAAAQSSPCMPTHTSPVSSFKLGRTTNKGTNTLADVRMSSVGVKVDTDNVHVRYTGHNATVQPSAARRTLIETSASTESHVLLDQHIPESSTPNAAQSCSQRFVSATVPSSSSSRSSTAPHARQSPTDSSNFSKLDQASGYTTTFQQRYRWILEGRTTVGGSRFTVVIQATTSMVPNNILVLAHWFAEHSCSVSRALHLEPTHKAQTLRAHGSFRIWLAIWAFAVVWTSFLRNVLV